MAAWLLTWNPRRESGARLGETAAEVQRGTRQEYTWSCGNNRSIQKGDYLFLLRQGVEPRGIVGFGVALGSPWVGAAWKGKPSRRKSLYVDLVWRGLLDADVQPILPVEVLEARKLKLNWATRTGGIRIDDTVAKKLVQLWQRLIKVVPDHRLGLSEMDAASAFEGVAKRRFVICRHREQRLRDAKIAFEFLQKGHLRCEVSGCGFDFEETYGPIGRMFAHIHHRKHLSEFKKGRRVSLADLAIVCANCRAMIHAGGKCRDMRTLISKGRKRS